MPTKKAEACARKRAKADTMRIRTIKPGFFISEDLSSVSAETHLGAAGLLCLADDDGFFNANPALIKAAIFPLRETSVSIHNMLTELSSIGFVRLGTGVDGRRYGQVVKFAEHQRINRPTPSKIKDLQIDWDCSVPTHGALSEPSLLELKGKEERKGKDVCAATSATPAVPAVEAVIMLPLNDGTEFGVTQADVDEWCRLYPATDVLQNLRKMRGWLLSRPKNRKTRSGVERFVNTWLAKEQDNAPAHGVTNANRKRPNNNGIHSRPDISEYTRNLPSDAIVWDGQGL